MIQTPIVFFSWFRDVLFTAFSSMGDGLLSTNARLTIFFRFSTEMQSLARSMSLPLTEARFHEPFVVNDYHRSILDGSWF